VGGPGAAALVTLTLLAGAPALAASLVLSPAERETALLDGQRSVTNDAFDAEWRVTNGVGDTVRVVTPFHRLVLAGRHAAFRNAKLGPSEPDKLLREQRERLVVWAELRGPRKSQRLPQVLSREEVARLLGGPKGTTPRALRDRALLELMAR